MRRPLRRATLVAAGALLVLLGSGAPRPSRAEDPLVRALAEQRERTARTPDDPGGHIDLGARLALMGESAAAEQEFRRALELDPANVAAHYNLGRLSAERGKRFAARRELQRALELDPGHAAASYSLGELYDAMGFERAARRHYRRAFELDPALADPARNPDLVGNRRAFATIVESWRRESPPGSAEILAPPAPAAPPETRAAPSAPAEPAAGDAAASGGGYARSSGAPAAPIEIGPESLGEKRVPRRERDDDAHDGAVLDAGSLGRGGTVNQIVAPSSPGRGDARAAPNMPSRRAPPQGYQPPIFQPPPRPFEPTPDSTGRIEREIAPSDAARFALGAERS